MLRISWFLTFTTHGEDVERPRSMEKVMSLCLASKGNVGSPGWNGVIEGVSQTERINIQGFRREDMIDRLEIQEPGNLTRTLQYPNTMFKS